MRWLNDPRLQAVMEALNAGGEVRVVGGAVRNALLGIPVADVDLATTLLPQEVMRIAERAGFGVHPTGLDHGTVTVTHLRRMFEVTTLRNDVATDGRQAVVAFTHRLGRGRRAPGLYMNALYCDAQGKYFDFTNGYADLRKRKVRFVGRPRNASAKTICAFSASSGFMRAIGKCDTG